jgi:hypothetical protein
VRLHSLSQRGRGHEAIRQAILLLVAHWYEHREPVEIGATLAAVPQMVSELLHPYRMVRP